MRTVFSTCRPHAHALSASLTGDSTLQLQYEEPNEGRKIVRNNNNIDCLMELQNSVIVYIQYDSLVWLINFKQKFVISKQFGWLEFA